MSLVDLFRPRLPFRSFVLEVTRDCNQDCVYCYNAWKHRPYPAGSLGLEDWKKIVLKLQRESRLQLLTISGGEPLLYPQLFELVDFIRGRSLAVNLLTNGALLDDEKAKRLVEAGVSVIEIPLVSADREMHARLKNTDDLDRVVEGINCVKRSGGRLVTVFVATKDNIAGCKEALEFGIFLGSSGMMFNRINPACPEQIKLMPSVEQLKTALGELNDYAGKFGYPVSVSVPVPPCALDMGKYPHLGSGYCPLGGKDSYYTVDFLGNLRVCNHSPRMIGNLLNQDLRDVLKHAYVAEFRTLLPEECRDCARASECRACCKASAETACGSLSSLDPFAAAARPPRHPPCGPK